MENNQFDQWIKESLNQYTPKDVKPDWSAMKNRLQQADHSDHTFDQSIREKLEDAQLHIKGAEWQAYHQKQIIFRERRRRILTTRVLEAVIILLLIWTVNGIVVPEVINYRADKNKIALNSDAPSNLESLSSNQSISTAVKESGNNSATEKNSISKNTKSFNGKTSSLPKKKISTNGDTKMMDLAKTNSTPAKAITSSETKNVVPLSSTGTMEESSKSKPATEIETEANHCKNSNSKSPLEPSELEAKENIIPREGIQLDLLPEKLNPAGISFLNLPLSVEIPKMIKTSKDLSTTYWIQGSAGGGLNFIATPKDVHLNLASRNSIGSAYVGGLSVLFDHQRWLLETGVTYAFLSNKPGIKNIYGNLVTGYFQKRFVQANYSLIDLPVLIHLKWMKSGPWELSSSGGMSITACVDTRFDFVKETADKNSTQGISNIPKESLLDNKSYIHGLTQDDSFSDNSFANLILGTRLSYVCRSDMNVFTNIQFKRMLNQNGFGPNADKYNQLLWSFGILKRL
jgi:hypothetical protein